MLIEKLTSYQFSPAHTLKGFVDSTKSFVNKTFYPPPPSTVFRSRHHYRELSFFELHPPRLAIRRAQRSIRSFFSTLSSSSAQAFNSCCQGSRKIYQKIPPVKFERRKKKKSGYTPQEELMIFITKKVIPVIFTIGAFAFLAKFLSWKK